MLQNSKTVKYISFMYNNNHMVSVNKALVLNFKYYKLSYLGLFAMHVGRF